MICDLLCPGVQLQVYAAPGLQFNLEPKGQAVLVSALRWLWAMVVIPGAATGGRFEQPGDMCSPGRFGALAGRSCCPCQEFRDPLTQCLHQGLLGWG